MIFKLLRQDNQLKADNKRIFKGEWLVATVPTNMAQQAGRVWVGWGPKAWEVRVVPSRTTEQAGGVLTRTQATLSSGRAAAAAARDQQR